MASRFCSATFISALWAAASLFAARMMIDPGMIHRSTATVTSYLFVSPISAPRIRRHFGFLRAPHRCSVRPGRARHTRRIDCQTPAILPGNRSIFQYFFSRATVAFAYGEEGARPPSPQGSAGFCISNRTSKLGKKKIESHRQGRIFLTPRQYRRNETREIHPPTNIDTGGPAASALVLY
jgi:hypothetical protein